MLTNYQDFIRDVVITLHLNIKETTDRKSFADPLELAHIESRLLAYHEVLGILRDSATQFNLPNDELGI
jgi:hypothetical protein